MTTTTIEETSRWLDSRALADAIDAPERAMRTVIAESGLRNPDGRDLALRVLARIDREAATSAFTGWLGTRYGGSMSRAEAGRLLDAHLVSCRSAS
jgi:hypothetical protein